MAEPDLDEEISAAYCFLGKTGSFLHHTVLKPGGAPLVVDLKLISKSSAESHTPATMEELLSSEADPLDSPVTSDSDFVRLLVFGFTHPSLPPPETAAAKNHAKSIQKFQGAARGDAARKMAQTRDLPPSAPPPTTLECEPLTHLGIGFLPQSIHREVGFYRLLSVGGDIVALRAAKNDKKGWAVLWEFSNGLQTSAGYSEPGDAEGVWRKWANGMIDRLYSIAGVPRRILPPAQGNDLIIQRPTQPSLPCDLEHSILYVLGEQLSARQHPDPDLLKALKDRLKEITNISDDAADTRCLNALFDPHRNRRPRNLMSPEDLEKHDIPGSWRVTSDDFAVIKRAYDFLRLHLGTDYHLSVKELAAVRTQVKASAFIGVSSHNYPLLIAYIREYIVTAGSQCELGKLPLKMLAGMLRVGVMYASRLLPPDTENDSHMDGRDAPSSITTINNQLDRIVVLCEGIKRARIEAETKIADEIGGRDVDWDRTRLLNRLYDARDVSAQIAVTKELARNDTRRILQLMGEADGLVHNVMAEIGRLSVALRDEVNTHLALRPADSSRGASPTVGDVQSGSHYSHEGNGTIDNAREESEDNSTGGTSACNEATYPATGGEALGIPGSERALPAHQDVHLHHASDPTNTKGAHGTSDAPAHVNPDQTIIENDRALTKQQSTTSAHAEQGLARYDGQSTSTQHLTGLEEGGTHGGYKSPFDQFERNSPNASQPASIDATLARSQTLPSAEQSGPDAPQDPSRTPTTAPTTSHSQADLQPTQPSSHAGAKRARDSTNADTAENNTRDESSWWRPAKVARKLMKDLSPF